jgi:hypothetical protein
VRIIFRQNMSSCCICSGKAPSPGPRLRPPGTWLA